MNESFCALSSDQLEDSDPTRKWVWDGYLAPGQITLFTSLWKSGKTTLLSHLLAQRRSGRALAGKSVSAGASIIVSEEAKMHWQARQARLKFGPGDSFFLQPFVGPPAPADWKRFIEHLTDLARTRGHDLVVIDSLGRFLPSGAANNASLLFDALGPLAALAQIGVAVLLIHHPSKAPAAEGMAARGCGALPAFVDFVLEMRPVDAKQREDRRRRILGFSRDPTTPRSQIIELSADGLSYTCCDEPPPPDEFSMNWHVLVRVFEDADRELTRDDILAQWPADFTPPKAPTLWTWIDEAYKRGLILYQGTGRRGDSYRYYLPEKMLAWKDDPMYSFEKLMRESRKKAMASLK
jgi:hypothetical protein